MANFDGSIRVSLADTRQMTRELAWQNREYEALGRSVETLTRRSNDLAAAMKAVGDAAAPVLKALGEAIRDVTAEFTRFLASVFGLTSGTKGNADALDDEAKAAQNVSKSLKKAEKEQKKYLASFDTIEKLGELQKKTEEDEDVFLPGEIEQMDAPQWLLEFWKSFSDGWKEFGGPVMQAFREALNAIGEALGLLGEAFLAIWNGETGMALLDALRQMFVSVLGAATDVANAFKNLWSGGGAREFLNALGGCLTTILGIIRDIAEAFRAAWSLEGNIVVEALHYALTSVLDLIISIGQAFREAWNGGVGQKIWEDILSIVTHVFELIGNIANRLREAWESNENGVAIWTAMLGIAEAVLAATDQIAAATAAWAATLDFEPLMGAVRNLLESALLLIIQIGDILASVWETYVLPMFGWLIESALPAVINFLASILEGLAKYPEILEALTVLVTAFAAAWALKTILNGVVSLVQGLNPLVVMLGMVVTLFAAIAGAWDNLSGIERAVAVIGALIAVAAAAAIAVGALQSALTLGIAAAAIVAGVVAVAAAINSATKRAESAGAAANLGRGGAMAYGAAGSDFGGIPHLANGAVISPNSEFLAVLGDQKHGVNIESPLSTIQEALANVMAENGGAGGNTQVTVNFTGSLSQLARVLQPEITVESARRGPRLVSGGAY